MKVDPAREGVHSHPQDLADQRVSDDRLERNDRLSREISESSIAVGENQSGHTLFAHTATLVQSLRIRLCHTRESMKLCWVQDS